VESHRVLRLDEIEQELRAALMPARGVELRVGRTRGLRCLDVADERDERVLMLSSGLRTWWSLTLRPPARVYGMWQSAHATPDRACTPWFHISNSGCCAFSVGAPDSACVQSLNPFSS
jgi:hypothetical protein